MENLRKLISSVQTLREISEVTVDELSYRLQLEGQSFNSEIALEINSLIEQCDLLGIDHPSMQFDDEPIGDREYDDCYGASWQINLAKSKIADHYKKISDRRNLFFFFKDEVLKWIDAVSPFSLDSESLVFDFSEPYNIWIADLQKEFGGDRFSFLPYCYKGAVKDKDLSLLPEAEKIHDLVHAVGLPSEISPKYWFINWGNAPKEFRDIFDKYSCLILACCLANEVWVKNDSIQVKVRGSKTQKISLWHSSSEFSWSTLVHQLKDAAAWVYEDKSEIRQKLILERISIDIKDGCWLYNLQKLLKPALLQAKDNYYFVLAERKDAYYKEMRDVLKDMKAQADLYATKIRDLVGSLSRDFLAIVIFIGLSFVSKFDVSKINSLLSSVELSVFSKILAGYLIMSCLFQNINHFVDAQLSYSESKKWLHILKNYVDDATAEKRFFSPIEARRLSLFIAMAISAFAYAFLALIMWNLSFVSTILLNQ